MSAILAAWVSAAPVPLHRLMSIGDSLEDFARAVGVEADDAYSAWHAHGVAVARAWQKPSRAKRLDNSSEPHVVIRSGRVLGVRR